MNNLNINIDNFEVYYIDYLDNQLSEELVKELFIFLEENPTIARELEGIESLILPIEEMGFDKAVLFKSENDEPNHAINNSNFDNYLVAQLEGELSADEKEKLQEYIAHHPTLEKDEKLLNATKLEIPKSIKFENKNLLYKLSIDQEEEIDDYNIDEFIIGFYENQLSEIQQNNLENYIAKNPIYAKLKREYGQIKIEADMQIRFANKERLHQSIPLMVNRFHSIRYAASIAAIFLIFLLFPSLLNNGFENIEMRKSPGQILEQKAENSQNQIAEIISTPESQTQKGRYTSSKTAEKHQGRILINKGKIKEVEIKNEPLTMDYKPILAYMNSDKTAPTGYYEVVVDESTFIKENNDLVKRLVKGVRKTFKINTNEISLPEDRITVWDVADVGIRGINLLTENEFALTKK